MSQGAMNFSFKDIYPSYGGIDTRTLTVPEAEDQNTLVDDQELASNNPIQTSASSNSIWGSLIMGLVLIILLSVTFR